MFLARTPSEMLLHRVKPLLNVCAPNFMCIKFIALVAPHT